MVKRASRKRDDEEQSLKAPHAGMVLRRTVEWYLAQRSAGVT